MSEEMDEGQSEGWVGGNREEVVIRGISKQ